jgi:hypothetical protein
MPDKQFMEEVSHHLKFVLPATQVNASCYLASLAYTAAAPVWLKLPRTACATEWRKRCCDGQLRDHEPRLRGFVLRRDSRRGGRTPRVQ